MIELGVRIKSEPLENMVENMDENNNKNNNFAMLGNHLQKQNNDNLSNIGVNLSLPQTDNSTSLCTNISESNSTLTSSFSNPQKENCPQRAYETKQAAIKRLLRTVQSNDFEHLKRLLEAKPDLNVFFNGQTVLHYCLLLGRDVNWAKQLVLSGADPNLPNQDGFHPIHLAAFNGLQETLSYLIKFQQNFPF